LSRSKDKMALYGDNMRRLCRAMEVNAHLFKKRPLGPVGCFVELKPDVDERGAGIVEAVLTTGLMR